MQFPILEEAYWEEKSFFKLAIIPQSLL
jgi:hypothetical protein